MAKPHWSLHFVEPMPEWLKLARCTANAVHHRGECSLASLIRFTATLALIEADDLPEPTVGGYGTLGLCAAWTENARQVLLVVEGPDVRWHRFAGGLEQQIPAAYRDSRVVLARENLTWLRGGSLFTAFTQSILAELAKGGRLL